MKKKLYRIPITDSEIFIENIPLVEYVKTYYPEIIQLENERVNIIYSGQILYSTEAEDKERNERLKNHCEYMKKYADTIGIPLYIYAVGNDSAVWEVETGVKLTGKYEAALGVRMLKTKVSLPTNYPIQSVYFMNNIRKRDRNIKHEYTYEEYKNINDLRLKVRIILGGLKYNLNWEKCTKIPIVENDLRLDYTLMLIVNYSLDIEDFASLCKLRASAPEVILDSNSELINRIDEVLIHYNIIKRNVINNSNLQIEKRGIVKKLLCLINKKN